MACFLIALVGWVALIFIGVNLCGFMVRGFVQQQQIRQASAPLMGTGAEAEVIRSIRAVVRLNVLGGIACIVYLYLLFIWWNGIVAAVGLVLILARIPDILLKIQGGQEAVRSDGMNPISIATVSVTVLAMPVLWWAACN